MSCGTCEPCQKCLEKESMSDRLKSRKLWVAIIGMIIILLLTMVGGYFNLTKETLDAAIQGISVLGGSYAVGQGLSDKK